MTHRDRAGDPSGQRAGRREAAGEPAAGESVGAAGSLDDVPHRPRLPSCPAPRASAAKRGNG